MKHLNFSLVFLLYLQLTQQLSLNDLSIDKSPPGVLSDGIGLGARGVLHYFLDLVESCDNVGDLNTWVASLEAYLSCEDAAWPTRSEEEILQKTDLQLMEDFCHAWPTRLKCTDFLANKLDSCYKYDESLSSDKWKIGSDAVIMSNTFARQICHNKTKYLEILKKNDDPPRTADQRSLDCYVQGRPDILECIWLRSNVSPQRTNVCSHIEIAKECIPAVYSGRAECFKTYEWINAVISKMQGNLLC